MLRREAGRKINTEDIKMFQEYFLKSVCLFKRDSYTYLGREMVCPSLSWRHSAEVVMCDHYFTHVVRHLLLNWLSEAR